ncbi:MAG: DUF748 domain-containing protein [Gammaproteobacteria bacterium]|nr:DUF748 domain-containing protein [Gammaproteobacteria bacterium]
MARILKSKPFIAAAIVAALVGLYALLGFKVAPGIVRDQAIKFVRENYGRELRVGEVRIDPFRLQIDVRDLALPDTDGKTMLAFRRLFVDFELSSLWERTFVFKAVELEAPLVRAVIRPDGTVNLLDLAPKEAQPKQAESAPPRVWLQSFVLDNGRVDIADFERARPFERTLAPVAFTLKDFRTTAEGGGFRFAALGQHGEQFSWNGRFAVAPVLASEGEFALGGIRATDVAEYLGDALPFGLTSGLLGLNGSYKVTYAESLQLAATLSKIEFTGLALRARGVGDDWVKVGSILLTDTAVALPKQTVQIANVTVSGVDAKAWMDPDGAVNLTGLFAPSESPAAGTAAPGPGPTEATGKDAANLPAVARRAELPNPWQVQVAGVDVVNAAIDFEDRKIAPGTRFKVAPVNVHVKDASLDLAKPLPVALDAVINDHAAFKADGMVTPSPLAADLAISLARARMTILQPYVLPLADLTITGGELDVEGRARLDPPEAPGPDASFEGDVRIEGFTSIDNALRKDLVNFREVKLGKIRYALGPDSASVDQVTVRQPYARVIVTPERVLNIQQVLDPKGTAALVEARRAEAASEARMTAAEKRARDRAEQEAEKQAARSRKAGKSAPAARLEALPAEGMPVRIREVRVDDGTLDFTDLSVQPNFSAKIVKVGGRIDGLSSQPTAHAKVDLKGQVDVYSPVTITGEIQPFAFERFSDIGMKFENISLPIFNPYSGEIAGYSIAKGKLTTDLHYRIQDKQLDAQHKIRIDQLEWGAPTATKGEATLPVKFATALLKDADGVINLDVPVTGTLDDPRFRLGPIIWQVIKNILTKAVTAPFKLLGALFKGAEEAQFVDFAPGSGAVDAATTERLASLAKSLVARPEIRLEVPVGVLPELDGQALADRAYEQQLAEAVQATLGAKRRQGAPPPSFEALEPQQKIDVLTTLVTRQTGAEPKLPEPPAPPEGASRDETKALRQAAAIDYLQKAARANVAASGPELDALGEARAKAIQAALLEGSTLEPTRVFLVQGGKVTAQDGKVRFELGLK